jgi:hypothetical protein
MYNGLKTEAGDETPKQSTYANMYNGLKAEAGDQKLKQISIRQ